MLQLGNILTINSWSLILYISRIECHLHCSPTIPTVSSQSAERKVTWRSQDTDLPLDTIHLQPPERKGSPTDNLRGQLAIYNSPLSFYVPDLKRRCVQSLHARGTLPEDSLQVRNISQPRRLLARLRRRPTSAFLPVETQNSSSWRHLVNRARAASTLI